MSYGMRLGALVMVLHGTVLQAATVVPAPTTPTSSVTIQPYACRSLDETGTNCTAFNADGSRSIALIRTAFNADGSCFVAPMGNGKMGVFSTRSEPEPFSDKDRKRYRALAALLDDDDFRKRSMATEALREMGTLIQPLLEESLRKAESRESRTRLIALLHDASLPIHTVHVEKVLRSLIRSVQYSPNREHLLVAGYDDSIKLLDAGDLHVVRDIPAKGSVEDVLFLNKGDRLAVGVHDMVQFWRSRTGERLPVSLTHTSRIGGLDASPDERWLAVSGDSKDVSIWDLKTHHRVHLLTERNRVRHAEFSPDGRLLALACEDGNVCVWDVPALRRRHTLEGHKGAAWHVTFSPDGHWLASTGKEGDVIVWDPRKGKCLAINDDRKAYCTPAFSPDSKFLLTLESDKIRLWRITKSSENGSPGANPQ